MTYTLLPGCELVLRAVDAENGKGLAGAQFYTENALGEEWAHPIDGHNLGAKDADIDGKIDPKEYLTDKEGNFKRLMGADGNYTYGVQAAPAGYELVEPLNEVSFDIPFGKRRVEQVFKFRPVKKD